MKNSIKKAIGVILSICLLFSLSMGAFAVEWVTAEPTRSNVLVNGSSVSFQAHNIGGNNYFKLRDIAKALSGTVKQFEVGVDGTKIIMTSGKSYTSVGGELSVSDSTSSVSGTRSSWSVYLDGAAVSLTAYNICGSNYFKLRDIAGAIDFGVGYDSSSDTVTINTATGYTTESNTDTSMVGLWELIGTKQYELYRFLSDGTVRVFAFNSEENSYHQGKYTVSAGKITIFDEKGEDYIDLGYETKTINGKTAMVLSYNSVPRIFYKQDNDDIVGAWFSGSRMYFFFSNGICVMDSIMWSRDDDLIALRYTASDGTLILSDDSDDSNSLSYDYKIECPGEMALMKMVMDGREVFLGRML